MKHSGVMVESAFRPRSGCNSMLNADSKGRLTAGKNVSNISRLGYRIPIGLICAECALCELKVISGI